MTLTELIVASSLMVVLLTVVVITMTLIGNVTTSVSSQYKEFDQALPALAPLQALLRAEVEPAPPSASGVPTPGFGMVGSASPTITNYALTFYSNIGTAYNNVTNTGTTAGPAMIVAEAISSTGSVVTSSSTCTVATPCSFQVREYLPITNAGVSTCPVPNGGTACQYPSTYTLVSNALNVINNAPIFTYTIFDPTSPFTFTPPSTDVQNNLLKLSTYGNTGSPNYSTSPNQALSGTGSCVAPTPTTSYPTATAACPADSIQSVGIDLMIGVKGSGNNGNVENQSIVYRYPQSPGSLTAPYQYTTAVG